MTDNNCICWQTDTLITRGQHFDLVSDQLISSFSHANVLLLFEEQHLKVHFESAGIGSDQLDF